MNLGAITGIAVLTTTVPIALVVLVFAYRVRSLPGVRAFMALIPLALWWSICFSLELQAPDLDGKLLWSNLEFISIAFLPVAFLVMTLQYTGRDRHLNRYSIAGLCLIPVITSVLLWAGHGLMRARSFMDSTGPYPVIGRTWGPWFWVHASYSYLLLLGAVVTLAVALLARPRLRHKRLTAILLGTLIPIAASLVETIVPSASPLDDLTPGFFTLAILFVAWGLLRVRIFNLVPVARHALVESMRDGLLVIDSGGQVVDLNDSASKLIGCTKAQILGRQLSECWDAWDQTTAPQTLDDRPVQLRLNVDGSERHYEARLSPLHQHGQVVAHMLVLSDVTERVLLEDSLRDQALTDGLTGLPNRALFMSKLGDTVRQARRHEDALFAVMVADLDRFKLINDTLGHQAGDVLLQSVAAKLRRCVREADTVARMGGDEFIILLNEISNERDLLPILRRIRSELRTPVYFGRQEMTAGSSMGIVIWDASYESPEEIVRAADTAMYQAKENGRDCYRIFDDEMHKSVLRSLKDEIDLRAAVRDHALSITYQPVVDLSTGRVHSLEALLRWHHPERGVVFPRDFLDVAESSGLIVPLGEIAMDEVFSHMDHWRSKGHGLDALPMRVNVSPRQLTEPEFVPAVLSRLAAWRIPPERMILEITENALARDPAKATQAMKRLRELGVRLCLDDFGAGRSSLQHLTTLPVQDLKIDPSYTAGVASNSKDLKVVTHISALAHTFGLQVVAEGVESADQWELLKEAGCDLAQGYHIASPMEADVVLDFVKDLACEKKGPKARSPR